MEGTVVAEGSNTDPVTPYNLKTYIVEELTIPQPGIVTVDGNVIRADKAWRITITGGPFQVRAMPAVIWIDDSILGVALETPDLSGIATITFDPSRFKEGSIIGISYGIDRQGLVPLPEKLKKLEPADGG